MLLSLFLSAFFAVGSPSITVEACRVHLTEMGKCAAFQDAAIYRVDTDEGGTIAKIEPLRVSTVMESFVNLEEFTSCMARWKLLPRTRYFVSLSAGTSGKTLDHWTISICPPESGCIAIRLPRGQPAAAPGSTAQPPGDGGAQSTNTPDESHPPAPTATPMIHPDGGEQYPMLPRDAPRPSIMSP